MPEKPSTVPADLGRRFGARVIDGIFDAWIIVVVKIELVRDLMGFDIPKGAKGAYDTSKIASKITIAIVFFIFELVPVALWGRTLGKSLLGLRVIDRKTGNRPGWSAAFLRWFIPVFSWFIPLVDVAGPMIVWGFSLTNKRRLGLHDLVAGTAVVRNQ